MKKISTTTFFILLLFSSEYVRAQQYLYTADLLNIKDDRVKVTLAVPKQTKDNIDFIFPNVIPGSYAQKEFGRYIDDFTAFDESGKELKVRKADKYNYSVENATRLTKIEYYVDDTWEEKNGKRFIFQPGGTNIEPGKNFVINHYGFFGYIDGLKNIPYEIKFLKPDSMQGYSYLNIKPTDATTDILTAPNYDILADNPVMYCRKDDASFKLGNSTIEICVYAEHRKVDAQLMAAVVKPVALALEKFFGKLPVDRYVFMFYLADPANVPKRRGKGLGSGFGALEHNHCSFYFMPEVAGFETNKKRFMDVCSHEFLHILTPLNLHSKEIEDFNFRQPVMSQHLWMYEGATEYFSHLVLVHDSLNTVAEFMNDMRRNMNRSETFDQFSMTEMSKNVIEPENQKRYLSVYSRGAILAMMLDILIIDRSNATNSLHEVLMKLSEKYGENKPFADDELIGEIVSLTHPDVKDFFDGYIKGALTPDYKDFFELIGYNYNKLYQKETYYFGRFGLGYNEEKNEFKFMGVEQNLLGIMEGDILIAINNIEVDPDNIDRLYEDCFLDNDAGKEVSVEVRRQGNSILLHARPSKAVKRAANYISPIENARAKQKKNLEKLFGIEPRK